MHDRTALPLRPLGATGLEVTEVCVGCAELGDMPETFAYGVAEAQALETIHAIFAGPFTFVDTAASYGNGESERRIGVVLQKLGGVPMRFVVATKADRDLHTGEFSGAQMRQSVERSLRLLGLDSLPLCYLHDPEHIGFEVAMAAHGPVEVLRQCQREGLIPAPGHCWRPNRDDDAVCGDGLVRGSHLAQQVYAAQPGGRPTLGGLPAPWCRSNQRCPVWLRHSGEGAWLVPTVCLRPGAGCASRQRAFALEAVCHRNKVPLAAAALQFSLRDPRITSTIVGISRPERVIQTLELVQLPIAQAVWDEIAAL